ncbi:MAG: oligosaccharide flippase family protein [Lachnospiraceae bacterium]|nr:oligosaccharide flippase family protein [Lachnospiraceae bacterium]
MGKKESNASRELMVNTIIFGFGTIASKFIMFALLPIYTAYLTTAELGAAELVVNGMNLLFPIATINILSALLRYGMDEKKDKKKVLQNTVIVAVAGITVVGCSIYAADLQSILTEWKFYLLLLLLCYTFAQVLSVFAKALGQTRVFAVGNIFYTLSLFVISIVLLKGFHRGTAGYLEGMIFANILTFLYFVRTLHLEQYIVWGKPDKVLLKEMVFFSLPLVINSVSWWVASFCDRFVLERYLGTAAVGIYSVSSKIPAVVSTAASVFMQAWVLSSIKEYQQGTNGVFFDAVFRKFSAFFISWAAVILCLCKPIMPYLAGGEFLDSWRYVPFLLCGAVWNGFGGFYSALYTSAKKNTAVMVTTLCGAGLNVILNFALIPNMGIQGAALATMISQLAVAAFRMADSRRFLIFQVEYKRLGLSVLLILLESGVLLSGKAMFPAAVICLIIITVYFSEIRKTAVKILRNIKQKG